MQSDGNLFSAIYFIKFQPQLKTLNQGLESATKVGLQSVLDWWIKSVATLDHKVWQNGLQKELGIANCGRVDYNVQQGLQWVAGLQSE